MEKAVRAPQQIVNFTRHFHATKAAPDDNKREIVMLERLVLTYLRFFQQLHDMKPQRNRIANRFEGKSVIGHARHGAKIHSRATRQHEVVIGHGTGSIVIAVVGNFTGVEINVLHLLSAAVDGWQHLAQRGGHGIRVDRSTGDFRQQRVKDHMIFTIEQNDLTSLGRKVFTQSFGTFRARKTASNDNQTRRCHKPQLPI